MCLVREAPGPWRDPRIRSSKLEARPLPLPSKDSYSKAFGPKDPIIIIIIIIINIIIIIIGPLGYFDAEG